MDEATKYGHGSLKWPSNPFSGLLQDWWSTPWKAFLPKLLLLLLYPSSRLKLPKRLYKPMLKNISCADYSLIGIKAFGPHVVIQVIVEVRDPVPIVFTNNGSHRMGFNISRKAWVTIEHPLC